MAKDQPCIIIEQPKKNKNFNIDNLLVSQGAISYGTLLLLTPSNIISEGGLMIGPDLLLTIVQ